MNRRSLRERESCSWSTPDYASTGTPSTSTGPISHALGPIKPRGVTLLGQRFDPKALAEQVLRKMSLEEYYNKTPKKRDLIRAANNGNYAKVAAHAGRATATSAHMVRAMRGTDVTPALGRTPGGVGGGKVWLGRPAAWARRAPGRRVQPVPLGPVGDAKLQAIVQQAASHGTYRAGKGLRLVRSLLRRPSAPLRRTDRRMLRWAFGVPVERWRVWAASKASAAARRAA